HQRLARAQLGRALGQFAENRVHCGSRGCLPMRMAPHTVADQAEWTEGGELGSPRVLVDLLAGLPAGIGQAAQLDFESRVRGYGAAWTHLLNTLGSGLQMRAELHRSEAHQGSILDGGPDSGRELVAVDQRAVVAVLV